MMSFLIKVAATYLVLDYLLRIFLGISPGTALAVAIIIGYWYAGRRRRKAAARTAARTPARV